ncbi:MAG: transketolase family protein [Bacteroidales bacterium]|jgi:transketolase
MAEEEIRLHSRGEVPTRLGFGRGLKAIAMSDERVVALGADITSSVNVDLFQKQFPERFFSLGIAEQNIMGVAAGMALSGKIPFAATYGVFSALRTTDQIRISICYNNVPVKIGGAHAGISVGPDGATHQALEDLAVMRAMPNMTVLSPCDATQTQQATRAAVEQVDGPAYIRFGREAVPDFISPALSFEVGKAQRLREGTDLTIVATGHMVWEALNAAEMLSKKGIRAAVINIHTLKPIDDDALIAAASATGLIVTVEEHQVFGGLGSAVAEVLSQHYPVPMAIIGMPDRFGESGTPEQLLNKYGLHAQNIAAVAMNKLQTIKS